MSIAVNMAVAFWQHADRASRAVENLFFFLWASV
jgi:hypothetical protein